MTLTPFELFLFALLCIAVVLVVLAVRKPGVFAQWQTALKLHLDMLTHHTATLATNTAALQAASVATEAIGAAIVNALRAAPNAPAASTATADTSNSGETLAFAPHQAPANAPPTPAADPAPTAAAPAPTLTREQRANEIGPGIANDIVAIDPSALPFASEITDRQLDDPAESISTSIAWVKARHMGAASPAIIVPGDGPIAASVGVFESLPPVERARYFQDHTELAPYANALFPNPADLNRYAAGNLGTFRSATWNGTRYVLPDGTPLGDLTAAQLGTG